MYSWVQGYLFCIGPIIMILHCVEEDDIYGILKPCHDEPCGGDFTENKTANNIL